MSIVEEIKRKFVRLSKGQRKVAQFVTANPNVVIANGAAEVGRQANVSESTVIRFCYAMDLSGYVELQERIRGYFMTQNEGSLVNTSSSTNSQDVHSHGKIMQRDIHNIQDTIQVINENTFNKSVLWIHEAEVIYILGAHQASSIASWLTHTLKTLRNNVKQIRVDSDDIMQEINNMNENATLILFEFDKQFADMKTILEIARMKKVKIIAITDTALSPLREYSNALFTLGTKYQTVLDMTPVLFSFMHAMIEEMVAQDKLQYNRFQKSYEQFENNILFLDTARAK